MAAKRRVRIKARSAGSQALGFAQPQCAKLRMPMKMASSSHESRMVSRLAWWPGSARQVTKSRVIRPALL